MGGKAINLLLVVGQERNVRGPKQWSFTGTIKVVMRLPVGIFFLPAYKTGLLCLIHRMWK